MDGGYWVVDVVLGRALGGRWIPAELVEGRTGLCFI